MIHRYGYTSKSKTPITAHKPFFLDGGKMKKNSIDILYGAINTGYKREIASQALYGSYSDFSPRQKEMFESKLKRINIAEGSVRSGKTFATLFLWCKFVQSMPKSAEFLLAGKTLTALKRNVLYLLQEIAGFENFSFSTSQKEGVLFGRKVYLEGADNERAEMKIRGMTLSGAYCDEITIMPRSFFQMILSRLSKRGAKIIGTTNPDSRRHWLLTDILENPKIDVCRYRFTIDDNIHLDPDYVKAIKNEYTGLQYDRMILGHWCAAEGAIYLPFNPTKHVISIDKFRSMIQRNPIMFCTIGGDWGGNKSATTQACVAFTMAFNIAFITEEYYNPKNENSEKIISDFVLNGEAWRKKHHASEMWLDSAEQLLVKSVRAKSNLSVRNSIKSKIVDRIAMLNRLFAQDRLFILEDCKNTIAAFESAVWNPNKEDERLDDGSTNIDSLDAVEYAMERYWRELLRL